MFAWIEDPEEGFLIRACADIICNRGGTTGMIQRDKEALSFLWNLSAPSNVKMFGWRFLLNTLPVRDQLRRRGIVVNDHKFCYVFCFREEENSSHPFYSCLFSRRIWEKVECWIGDGVDLDADDLKSF